MHRFLPIACLLTSLFSVGLKADQYTLTIEGKANARIQANPTPTSQEFQAVSELQNYLKKISGAWVKRTTYPGAYWRANSDTPETVEILPIVLENGRHLLPEDIQKKLDQTDNPEAFYLKTGNRNGKMIWIAGKTPQAVLYGTLTFIEEYLGVRWFHAGEEGEHCPKTKTITLDEIDVFRQPWLPNRIISAWSGSVAPWKIEAYETWLTRNKFVWNINHAYSDLSREKLDHAACGNRLISGGGHLTFEQAIPSKLFAEHPELFPLKDGKRVCESRSQRCLANPIVQKMVIDHIVNHCAYGASFSISYHDSTDGWCSCPECIRMGTGENGKFSYTNLAHAFTRLISEAVLKQNPQAKLHYDMYSQFRPFPDFKDFRYDPRMIGIYCPHQRCYVHAFADANAECNRRFIQQLDQWRQLGTKLGIFDYYCSGKVPYTPLEYILAKDMKYYHSIKLDTWIEDCTSSESQYPLLNWQLYYAAGKLFWNADLDIDQLMQDTYLVYYGIASAPMLKYQQLRRELWETAPGHALYGGPKRYAYCLTVPGAKERLLGYLGEAEKMAENDPILLKRIANDRQALQDFWITESDIMLKSMSAQNDIPITKLQGELLIDGQLSEESWRQAPFVTGFKNTRTGEAPTEETRIRILYDSDNWYIGIEAMTEHAWGKLRAEARDSDGNVWEDDSIETFIMPPGEDYYQLIVNSIGTLYDAKLRIVDFASKTELKTSVLEDRYVIEMRVPVNPMQKEKILDGEVWRFHFYRNCHNLQPPQADESSSLDATPPHEQTLFRRAVVGYNVIPNGNFAILEPVKEDQNGILSAEFPKSWSGSNVELLRGDNNKNVIHLKGTVLAWLQLGPEQDGPRTLKGEIMVSGKGTISAWISTCIRKPDDQRPFGHEIKTTLLEAPLPESPAALKFETQLEPYQQGYIYFQATDAKIESISASLIRK
ncbi:MAG: DUF4838 domain-containing protein [Lentisphaeria bacterium]